LLNTIFTLICKNIHSFEKKNVYVPLCLVTIVGPDHYVNGKTEELNDKDRMKNSIKKGLERRKKCKKREEKEKQFFKATTD